MILFTSSPCDNGVIRAAPDSTPCSTTAKPWILATTILASSMVFVDGTVVNIALPALQRELTIAVSDAQWVVEAYALMLAALLLVGGTAGDRFGRRRIFSLGIALFALSSLCCGFAANIEQLIAARAIQGIGGALLVPSSLAIISASFPGGERGKAIGTWSGYTAITAAAGPVLGGFLIDHFSWRYAFFINIPVTVAVLAMIFRYVPESRGEKAHSRLDWFGAVTASIGLGSLVFGLIESSNKGWSDVTVIGALALSALAFGCFATVEIRHPSPMLPLHLFRSRDFSGANLLTLLLYASLGGGLFFFPLNLIQVQHYSTVAAGAALLPFILIMFVLSRWAGGLVERYGAKRPLVLGPVIAALGFALFAVPGIGGSYWITFFPAVVVLGLGMTITVAPLTTTVMNSVATSMAGAASGINNAISRVAALLAIALLGIVMTTTFNFSIERRSKALEIPPNLLAAVMNQRSKLAAIELPVDAEASNKAALKQVIDASFVDGFRWVMLISALLALISAGSAFMLIDTQPRQGSNRSDQ